MPYRRFVSGDTVHLFERLLERISVAGHPPGHPDLTLPFADLPDDVVRAAIAILEPSAPDGLTAVGLHDLGNGWILEITDRCTKVRWPSDER